MGRFDSDTDTIDETVEGVEEQHQPSLREELESAFENPEPDDNDESDAGDDDTAPEGQPRDEYGRWTKAQQEHFEEQERQRTEAEQGQQPEGELVMAPPHGWSPTAKSMFAELPPEVQEAVAIREQQINNGFRKLQDYKGLDQFAETARQSGTTLAEAFQRYKAAEDALDQDFMGGIHQLCEMYGVHPVQLAQGFLSHYGAPAPRGVAMDPQSHLLAQQLHDTQQAVRTLISEREQAEQRVINDSISEFSQSAVYFEDVRQDMATLIRTGQADTLEEAYDKACWLHPEIRELRIKEQVAPQEAQARVQRARRASGSLPTGAPAGSSQGSSANSIRDALAEAWDQSQV